MKTLSFVLSAIFLSLFLLVSCGKKIETPVKDIPKTETPDAGQTYQTDSEGKTIYVLDKENKANVTYIKINCSGTTLSDVRVRRALTFSLDRTALAKAQKNAVALASPIPDIIPFSVGGKSKSYRKSVGDKMIENTDFAGLMMKQAGFTDGAGFPNLEFIVPENYVAKDIIMKWASTLKIFVNVSALDDKKYKAALADGKYDLALVTEPCAPDATEYLKKFADVPSYNNSDYKSLMDAIVSLPEDQAIEKLNLFEIAEGILFDTMPSIPLYYTKIAQ